jgi:hypothetical protein
MEIPRFMDHLDLWLHNGRGVLLTGQPYGVDDRGLEQIRELIDHGFGVGIDASASWHFPGRTVLIEVWNPAYYNHGERGAPSLEHTMRALEIGRV